MTKEWLKLKYNGKTPKGVIRSLELIHVRSDISSKLLSKHSFPNDIEGLLK